MKINNKQVTTTTTEHEYLGTVWNINIGIESGSFFLLGYMLSTTSPKASFEFCKEMASYEEWLNVFSQTIFK